MKRYVVLLRGINVGGKNKVGMVALRHSLEQLGFSGVQTYIASGNAIVDSPKNPDQIQTDIEKALTQNFELDSELIKVLVLSEPQLRAVVEAKPKHFGEEPKKYHSDIIFLMNIEVKEAMQAFDPKEGVDTVWPGTGVVYSQRLSAERTKSRLSKVMSSPAYKSMTIRTWNTVIKLHALMNSNERL